MQGHYWYKLLDKSIMPKNPNATMAIVGKMVTDQALFAPVCTAVFYGSLALMEGRPGAIPAILQVRYLTYPSLRPWQDTLLVAVATVVQNCPEWWTGPCYQHC